MLFAEDPYTKQLMFRMVIDNKGKDWRVMTAPKNPTNTNFLDIITADVVMINWPKPKGFIGYYTIDHEKRLHDRKKCNCEFNEKKTTFDKVFSKCFQKFKRIKRINFYCFSFNCSANTI